MKRSILLLKFIILSIYLSFGGSISVSTNINLRATPHIGKNVLCTIPQRAIITTEYDQNYSGTWTKVSYNGQQGYVKSNLLTHKKNHSYKTSPGYQKIKHYRNSAGNRVQSPTYYDSAPAGACAECYDGTYSFSQSRRGTCSHHGGVKRWLH